MNNLITEFDKLWNYSDPKATRIKFEEHLASMKQKDVDYELQLKTQIARTHSLSGEFDRAHELLNEVESMLTDEMKIANVRYLLERGRTYNFAGEKLEAEQLFKKAFELSKKLGTDNYTIDAAHMVAIAVNSLDEKVEWTNVGVCVASDSDNEKVKGWIGVFLNNSGWDLFEAKRYEDALEKFIKCEEFHKSTGNRASQDIARWSIAKTYRFLERVDESLSIQEALLSENDGVDPSGYTYEELGELYLLKGDEEKAGEFFSKAHAILSQDTWLQKNEASRLDRLKNLSK